MAFIGMLKKEENINQLEIEEYVTGSKPSKKNVPK